MRRVRLFSFLQCGVVHQIGKKVARQALGFYSLERIKLHGTGNAVSLAKMAVITTLS